MTPDLVQQRHKPPRPLQRPRELLIVCAPMHSSVNLSRIARAAGCCGLTRMICCGGGKLREKIARDGAETVNLETHRTPEPVLRRLAEQGYHLVGLEQTAASQDLYSYAFPRKTALVVGNERLGLSPELLRLLEDVVEIPVYGRPFSHNAATAAAMAMYEYCRQYPHG